MPEVPRPVPVMIGVWVLWWAHPQGFPVRGWSLVIFYLSPSGRCLPRCFGVTHRVRHRASAGDRGRSEPVIDGSTVQLVSSTGWVRPLMLLQFGGLLRCGLFACRSSGVCLAPSAHRPPTSHPREHGRCSAAAAAATETQPPRSSVASSAVPFHCRARGPVALILLQWPTPSCRHFWK